MSTKAPAFELSDNDRALLVEALGEYAWQYRGEAKAERCEALATQLRSANDEPAPTTERMPQTRLPIALPDGPWFL